MAEETTETTTKSVWTSDREQLAAEAETSTEEWLSQFQANLLLTVQAVSRLQLALAERMR